MPGFRRPERMRRDARTRQARDRRLARAGDVAAGVLMLGSAILVLVVVVPMGVGRGESSVAMAALLAVTVALVAAGIGLLVPPRPDGRRRPGLVGLLAAVLIVVGVACLVDPAALTASPGSRGPQTPAAAIVFGVLLLVGAAAIVVSMVRRARRERSEAESSPRMDA